MDFYSNHPSLYYAGAEGADIRSCSWSFGTNNALDPSSLERSALDDDGLNELLPLDLLNPTLGRPRRARTNSRRRPMLRLLPP